MKFKLTISNVGWCSLSEHWRGPLHVEYEAFGELNHEGYWESYVAIAHIWASVEDIDGFKRMVDINQWRLLKEWFIDELREKGEAYFTEQELDDDLWEEWCKEIRSRTRKHS